MPPWSAEAGLFPTPSKADDTATTSERRTLPIRNTDMDRTPYLRLEADANRRHGLIRHLRAWPHGARSGPRGTGYGLVTEGWPVTSADGSALSQR
jgi:hypothetical protein